MSFVTDFLGTIRRHHGSTQAVPRWLRVGVRVFFLVGLLSAASLPDTLLAQTHSPAITVDNRVGKIRWAYYVPYAADSLTSLQQNIDAINYLSPYWYQMDGEGNLVSTGSSEVGDKNRDLVMSMAGTRGVKVLPMIKNSATYASFTAVLSDPELRKKSIGQIVKEVRERNYEGAHIDYEGVNAEDRPLLSKYMAELASALRREGKMVTMAVPAKDRERSTGWAGAYDYAALAPSNDLIVIMTYGYGVAIPQSTAPYPWVEGSVRFAASQIPADKLLLGLALYGYEWNLTAGTLKALRYPDVMARVKNYSPSVQYDERTRSPFFRYYSGGEELEVWYEDARSNGDKLGLVSQYGLGGAASWRMGQEDSGLWGLYRDRLAFRTWYLAEGSTANPYHTWILLQNPNPFVVTAKVTYMRENAAPFVKEYDLKPNSRFSIFANDVVPNSAFSTKVEALMPIFVERAMYFGYDGHDSTGINEPSRTWYLPEGETRDTHTWVLLMNPNDTPAQAKVTFMTEKGENIVQEFTLRPTSRLNVFANTYLSATAFSTLVQADVPIVSETASYFSSGNRAGYGSPGSTFASQKWYVAEGYTGHTVRLAIMNPNDSPARVQLTYLTDRSDNRTVTVDVGPRSRQTVLANTSLQAGTNFSTIVDSNLPVVVQRTSILPEGTGGHSSLATAAPAKTWFLPEGSTADPFQEYVAVANPNPTSVNLRVTLMSDSGESKVLEYTVLTLSRFSLDINQLMPNRAVSIRMDADQPIAVERTMYFGRGATASTGIPQ